MLENINGGSLLNSLLWEQLLGDVFGDVTHNSQPMQICYFIILSVTDVK